MPLNVLIIGHSFTRRLASWSVQNGNNNLNIANDRVQIYWHGMGGALINRPKANKSLWSELHLIHDLEVDATFLDIGSNDLCDSSVSPFMLATDIISFAMSILQRGSKCVVLGEILPCQGNAAYNTSV